MTQEQARELTERTLQADFDRRRFGEFIGALLKTVDFSKHFQQSGVNVREAFRDKFTGFERIGQFTDEDGKKIDILIVNLKRAALLERARSSLRAFAADYLQSDRGFGKAAVLVAYAVKDERGHYAAETEWRFSYATLEKALVGQESGKFREQITRNLPARRYSFLVGRKVESYTAKRQFFDLLKSQSAPKLQHIEAAFSVEKVTDEFYVEYEKLFKRLEKEVAALRAKDAALDAHLTEKCLDNGDFAKKLLGQIVFLYFLQRKGWFGVPPDGNYGEGDKRYLRQLFNDRHRIAESYSSYARASKNFFNNILEPLFYEALAYKRPNDIFDRFHAKIPFLNGGLFEPKYDYLRVHVELPDALFSNRDKVSHEEDANGILDIFDRYNFTVNESERLEKEVAIDPEMLGHVFENLLVKEERGQSGTFYTPQIIVNYMCRQSLLDYLATRLLAGATQQMMGQDKLAQDDLEDFINLAEVYAEYETKHADGEDVKKYEALKFRPALRACAPEIDRLLREVKVCDPAIGSGAFPVGMLQEIVRLRSALVSLLRKNERELAEQCTPYAFKLHAIENSLYGVDKEQSAVDIARLRLWLALVVDEDDLRADKSLPNLDYKISQGNSLLNEFRGLELIPPDFVVKHSAQTLLPAANLKAQLQQLQSEYFIVAGKAGRNSLDALRIFRRIEDLNAQLKKEKEKPADSRQGDLLRIEGRGQEQIKRLYAKHQQLFECKDKDDKDRLRRAAEAIVVEFINEHLAAQTKELQELCTKTEGELSAERANVRRAFNEDRETPKVKALAKRCAALQARLEQRRAAQAELKTLWQIRPDNDGAPLDLTAIAPANFTTAKPKDFTLWELQFVGMFFDAAGEARANGGFDIVIANPPYIRQEKIKEYKPAFERRFTTYAGTADILVYFYEQAVNLLRGGGTLTFITSNKYFRAGYGAGLRRFLGDNTQIRQIIDFGDAPVFEAAAYASLIVLNKTPAANNQARVWTFPQHEPVADFEEGFRRAGFALPQKQLKPEIWRLEALDIIRLLEKVESVGMSLSAHIEGNFYRGITSGLNEAFVVDRVTRDSLISEGEAAIDLFRPFLFGKDVKRWSPNYDGQYLIRIESSSNKKHPWSNKSAEDAEQVFAAAYPSIHKHFMKYRNQLIKRDDQGTYFWELRACKYWDDFEKPKIIYPDIVVKPQFAWDTEKYHLANTLYMIPTSEKWLLAVLNSQLSFWFYSLLSPKLRGGYVRYIAQYVEQIPIPPAEDWQKEIIEKLVDYVLFLTKTGGEQLMVNYFESVINALVYELFLADELHAADKRFFAPLQAENLPALPARAGAAAETIGQLCAKLSDVNHPVRRNLCFLSNLESVRIIEGK